MMAVLCSWDEHLTVKKPFPRGIVSIMPDHFHSFLSSFCKKSCEKVRPRILHISAYCHGLAILSYSSFEIGINTSFSPKDDGGEVAYGYWAIFKGKDLDIKSPALMASPSSRALLYEEPLVALTSLPLRWLASFSDWSWTLKLGWD